MGAVSGRVDALVFMAGLIAGVLVFVEAYAGLAAFVWSGEMGGVTLADLLGLPFWALAVALIGIALGTFWLMAGLVVVMALGMFWLVRKLERPAVGNDLPVEK